MSKVIWWMTMVVCLGLSRETEGAPSVAIQDRPGGLVRVTVTNGGVPPFDVFASTNPANPASWTLLVSGAAGQADFDLAATNRMMFYRVVRQYELTASTNLFVHIGAGTVANSLWHARVPAGRIQMQPASTNYIMLDLRDLSYHVWQRNIDRGSVCLGSVITDSNSIQSITMASSFDVPTTRIPLTRAKLAAGQPVKVLMLGDSLTAGVGATVGYRWFNLLMDAATLTNTASLGVRNVTYVNAGVSGSVSRCGMAFLGSSDTGVASSLLASRPDLAFVCYGANALATSREEYGYLETIVRTLRRNNIEVILWNGDYPLWNDPKVVNVQTDQYRRIADRHGAEFIDMCERIAELNRNPSGTISMNTYIDVVHQNNTGHQWQANAFKSLFSIPQVPETIPASDDRLLIDVDGAWFPNKAILSFTPCGGKTNVVSSALNTNLSPAVFTGGRTPANATYQIGTGSNILFHLQRACAVDFYGWSPNNLSILPTVYDGDWRVDAIPQDIRMNWGYLSCPAFSQSNRTDLTMLCPFSHAGVQLQLTNGTFYMEAAVGQGFDGYIVNNTNIIKHGSFEAETETTGRKRHWYVCDNESGTSLTIPFTGNALHLLLQAGSAAGIIQCSVDGQTVLVEDLRNAAALGQVKSLVLWPASATLNTRPFTQYGEHLARITLIGADASATKPSTGNHRLGFQEAYAIDAR
jgi:lysophospholipase L1-like esterase